MAFVIDDELLDLLRGRSLADLVAADRLEGVVKGRIGFDLARWWVQPEALEEAGYWGQVIRHATELPDQVGSCWIILVQEEPRRFPILREAMLLPLQWKRGLDHSRALPPALRDLADRVLQSLQSDRRFAKGDQPRWGLGLNERVLGSSYSFEGLTSFRFESGFASLAASLLLAAEGARPDCYVWASAGWADGTVADVERLDVKLDYARELGARTFFLPKLDSPPVQDWLAGKSCGDLQVLALAHEQSPRGGLRAWLGDYSRQLGIEPDPSEPMVVRCNHYFRLTDRQEKREYYCRAILDDRNRSRPVE